MRREPYNSDEADGIIKRNNYDPAEPPPGSIPPPTYSSSAPPAAPPAGPAPTYTPNPVADRSGFDTGSYKNVVNMLAANKDPATGFANKLATGLIDRANDAVNSNDSNRALALGKDFSALTRNPVSTFANQQGGGYTAGAGRLDNYFLGATPGAINALRAAQGQYAGIMARLGNAPTPGAPAPTPGTPTAPPAPPTPQEQKQITYDALPTYKQDVRVDPETGKLGEDEFDRQRRIEGRNRGVKEIY